ncbi:MAG TPA: hypothetical protein VF669_06010 [Tepidisphaeraceae bacterium]
MKRVLPSNRQRCKRRGFTFGELVLGLAMTSLVAGAVGALMMAVSRGWELGQTTDNTTSLTTQSVQRVTKIIHAARQVGALRTGSITTTPAKPAAMLIWKGDLNSDSKMQLSELGMLEFDSATSQLIYYEVSYPTSWTSAQKQANVMIVSDASFWDDATIDSMKSAAFSTFMRQAGQATHVTAAEFHRIDSSSTVRSGIEFALKFGNSGTTCTKYGTVTSRTPATLPAGKP